MSRNKLVLATVILTMVAAAGGIWLPPALSAESLRPEHGDPSGGFYGQQVSVRFFDGGSRATGVTVMTERREDRLWNVKIQVPHRPGYATDSVQLRFQPDTYLPVNSDPARYNARYQVVRNDSGGTDILISDLGAYGKHTLVFEFMLRPNPSGPGAGPVSLLFDVEQHRISFPFVGTQLLSSHIELPLKQEQAAGFAH